MIKPAKYRDMIDELVRASKAGQGQIGAMKVRAGLWNQNATKNYLPGQHRINLLLKKLSREERELVAQLRAQEFSGGVFETLKALEEFEVEPFIGGYEGSPYHDFVGRLDDDPWRWPSDCE